MTSVAITADLIAHGEALDDVRGVARLAGPGQVFTGSWVVWV